MVLQTTDYLYVGKPCENPKARIVCFPHSGGGPSAFAAWSELLEAHQVEVVAVSPPGRERRTGHPLLTDWRELVAAVSEALSSSGLVDDVPYAFFGHSLGALLAYETARSLDANLAPGRPRPLHLFASGHGGPATKGQARDIPEWGRLHTLQDAALVRAVQAFGFLPAELAADEGLMRAVVPALRADLQMYEDYAPDAERKPLALGITAMGGREDAVAPAEHLGTWGMETSRVLGGPVLFPGGHFFLDSCREEVLASIRGRLAEALDTLPRSVQASTLALPEACGHQLLQEGVLEVARQRPEVEALVGETERVSYGELLDRVQLLARKLQGDLLHGKAGQVVALLMAHNPTYVTCMLGIWHAAAVLIVIEAHFPAALCKEICEESGTVAAVCSPEHGSKFSEVSGCQTLVLQGDWVATLSKEQEGRPIDLPRAGLEDVSILMMTSGTTGKPKTIAGSNYFMHVGTRAKAQLLPYGEEDCREGFNVMFVWEVVRPLLHGLTSFIIPDEAVLDPQLFVSTLQKHRCSRVLTTPSLLATVLQYCARDLDTRLDSMRTWLMCGEVLPMKTVQTFRQLLPNCRLVNDYSTWESGDVSYAVVAPRPAYEPSAVFAAAGALAPGCRAAIVDPESKRVLPHGVPGELYIGGTSISSGYYAQADLTNAKFVDPFSEEMKQVWPGKWYKTGDSGRFIGEPPILELRGRIDSTVKIRGFKVGLPVVEAAIQETAGVATCAVLPVYEAPAIVDSLLCFLKLEDGLSFEEVVQRVKREAAQRIPRWMMPSYFKPMPEAVSGGESRKLDRKRLAQLFDLQTLRESQAAEQAAPEAQPGQEEGDEEDTGIRAIVRAVWARALNLNPQALDFEENFFDIGGHSTLAAKIAAELSNDYGLPVTVLDIYSHSSLGALLDFVDSKNGAVVGGAIMESRRLPRGGSGTQTEGIAIVGLAGKFPGAEDADTFWANLQRAAVSATFLSKDFLRSKGVPEATVNHKDFVPCAYKINDADKFDHTFFGIGRHEASLMDPQHRVFIESSWAALENAAIPPRTGLSDTVVGVFAAAGIDGYLVHHLDGMPLKDSMDPQDIFLAEIGNEKDYIATRVSYLLDFTGPSMNVNSACSSALVACVQAAAAITAGQCDAAVAGASSITFPNLGFLYQDGLVNSVDGYVRPFDEKADGTVFGDAVASLVLRRRDEAGALVWGGMRGFAVTNDGGQKAGYAAPSPMGQSMAVMGAQQMMGEDPWSISYVECHCTGTRVGDGIEVRGLMDAFAQLGGKRGAGEASVALGSVKGNIAHANCAAGATGLIKTLMMLRSRSIAPTANFAKLNPKINLDRSPFFVNPELCSWEVEGRPLRAGVSSFGIGGTNAHIILEEPPATALAAEPSAGPGRVRWGFHVLPLSGRSPQALHAGGERLAAALRTSGGPRGDLDRVAYTLQTGRAGLPLRKALVLPLAKSEGVQEDLATAAEAVEAQMPDIEELEELEDAAKKPQVAFVFPGQGSQYFGMARGLYSHVPLFHEAADRCCDLLAQPERLGADLRPLLFPSSTASAEEERQRELEFARPSVLQPALFIVEYSLAQVFLAIGISPVAAAGHSLGEYAAAVVGGLLSLESAVSIVAARAKSTESLAEDGAMLSVAEWTEPELTEVARGRRPGLWLAAVNSPAHAVISGETAAVDALEAELKAAGRKCTKLHVRKAFHSGLVAKAADTLKGLGMPKEAEAGAAAVPVASNFTGGWLNALQLKDGAYWTSHMRGTVRWRDNAEKLLTQWQPAVVLEVGPGSALSTLTAKCVNAEQTRPAFLQATRHPKAAGVHDVEALLAAVGKLWEVGCNVDWRALHTKVLGIPEPPQLLRLPTYAFDQTSLWANPERSVYVDSVEEPSPVTYAKLGQGSSAAAAAKPEPPRFLMRYGERLPQQPSIRAYCLPFASGSATLFAPLAEQADTAFEVVAVELPGRGARADELMPAGEQEDAALLDTICEAILADLQGAKYVLVGFSMGGGLCADLALRLAERGAPAPLALYIAGRRPPALDPASIGPITMSNEELAEYAFAPPEVAQSPEFVEHVVPLLRGDLEVDARCERRLSAGGVAGKRLPPGVGVELFCGTDDSVAPWREAPGWQRFTQEPVGVHYFPGGHEFMQECRPLLHAAIRRDALSRLVRQRSFELALLAAQGLAPPGAPAPAPTFAAAAPAKQEPEKRELPLYAVRWTPATASDATAEQVAPFFVDLGKEPSEAQLAAEVAAARAGKPIMAACSAMAGVLSGEPLEVEVRQAWHFVQMVQRLLEEGCAGRLVLVCPAAASGAMVAGASKAVALEASELQIQRIFLPSAELESVEARAGELLGLARRHAQEVDLWVQDDVLRGTVFAPRLEPMPEPSTRLPCFPKRSPDGSLPVFILTGATGGLGKAVVEWMLKEQGLLPEQLVLLRRAGSAPLAGDLAACRAIEVERVDSEMALLASPLRELRSVAGILHLAGVLDDGIVQGMTEERMRKVARPKCDLLAALLRAGKALAWPLRWAVGFSSTSSLFGYPGQVNYCAANAVLDQLAAFGGAGPLPEGDQAPCRVLAINWGPWAEAGMAKVGTKAYEQALQDGDTPLPNATALACLAAALRVAAQAQPAAAQFCACDVDWLRSQWRHLPILELLGDDLGPAAAAAAAAAAAPAAASAAAGGDARKTVQDFLLQHTKSGSSWKRVQGKSLHQLGLDSLEIVQVRNLFNKRFSVSVPLGLVADSSRKLGELTDDLLKHVDP